VRNQDGSYTYTPAKGFTGTDSFTYTVSDGKLSTTAKITLTVSGKGRDDDDCHKDRGGCWGQDDDRSACIVVQSKLPDCGSQMGLNGSQVTLDWSGCATPAISLCRDDDWVADFLGVVGTDLRSLAEKTGLVVCLGAK
jgi:hypothetical protein